MNRSLFISQQKQPKKAYVSPIVTFEEEEMEWGLLAGSPVYGGGDDTDRIGGDGDEDPNGDNDRGAKFTNQFSGDFVFELDTDY